MDPDKQSGMCEEGLEDLVKNLLPDNYKYKVLSHNVTEYSEKNISCVIEFRVNVTSEDTVKTFLSNLNISTGCSYNIQSGRQDKRPTGDNARTQISGYRKCCLNVSHCEGKGSRQPGKNTDCKASINFRLENPVAKLKVLKEDRSEFPLWVKVVHHHNHSIRKASLQKWVNDLYRLLLGVCGG